LFVQINAVVAAVVNGHQAGEVAAQMDNLIRNVADHFEAEERLLEAAGVEGLPIHAAAHGKLMERAVVLVNHYRNARLPIGDLLQFLMQDLIASHVMVEDLRCFAPGAADPV
jgi:hemerythrin